MELGGGELWFGVGWAKVAGDFPTGLWSLQGPQSIMRERRQISWQYRLISLYQYGPLRLIGFLHRAQRRVYE